MVNRYFTIWKAFFRNTLSRDMEFKLNFIFEMFIDAIYYLSLFFFFKIIFQFTQSLGEFNQDAVVIFLITLYIADSLYVFFLGGNVFNINTVVKQGDLDFILLINQYQANLQHSKKVPNKLAIKVNIYQSVY